MREPEPPPRDEDDEDDRLRALLRPREATPDLLPRVQQRIRQRSRGRFFADAWSLGTGSPTTYVSLGLVALLVLMALYVLLAPGGLAPGP